MSIRRGHQISAAGRRRHYRGKARGAVAGRAQQSGPSRGPGLADKVPCLPCPPRPSGPVARGGAGRQRDRHRAPGPSLPGAVGPGQARSRQGVGGGGAALGVSANIFLGLLAPPGCSAPPRSYLQQRSSAWGWAGLDRALQQ